MARRRPFYKATNTRWCKSCAEYHASVYCPSCRRIFEKDFTEVAFLTEAECSRCDRRVFAYVCPDTVKPELNHA